MSAGALRGISTVLLDVGNTIQYIDHALIAATITRHGYRVETEDVVRAEGVAKAVVDEWFRADIAADDGARQRSYLEIAVEELGVHASAVDVILAELRAEDARESLWRVMLPDTPDILRQLRNRGYRLGVVSNADGRVPAMLRDRGIAEQFEIIVDSYIVGVEKPDRRIFEIALQGCEAQPESSVYVGDIYEIDIVGGRNAGLVPILLDPHGHYGEVDCLRIDHLRCLLDLLPKAAA